MYRCRPTAQAYTRYVSIVYYKLKLKEDMYIFWKVSYYTILHAMKCIFSTQVEPEETFQFSYNILLHHFHPVQSPFSIIVAVADTDAFWNAFIHKLWQILFSSVSFWRHDRYNYDSIRFQLLFAFCVGKVHMVFNIEILKEIENNQ